MIDDQTISASDLLEPILPIFERWAAELPADAYHRRAAEVVRRETIEAVARHLVWKRAKGHINDQNEAWIVKAVDRMEKDRINREFGGSETLYEKYLARQAKRREDVRERLRKTVVIDSYLRERLYPQVSQPRKSELLEYYRANAAEFHRTGRREMYLIDIPIAAFFDATQPMPPSPAQVEEATRAARAAAQAAAAALKAGEPFEEVARRYSRGLHTSEGGAWGFISEPADGSQTALQGRWAEPSRRLFEMTEGDVSEVIESARSFFIVKVGRVEPGRALSFQEAQPEIVEKLRQEKFGQLRAEFLQKELERATLGSLEGFMDDVLAAIPPSTYRPATFREDSP